MTKRPKKRPKKNYRTKANAFYWLLSLVVAVVLVVAASVVHQTIWAKSAKPAHILVVKTGDTYQGLLKNWQDGPLSFQWVAKLYLRLYANQPLQAGAYQLPAQASLQETLAVLAQGAKSAMIRVQIIEGKTLKDLYDTLRATEGVVLESLSDEQGDYKWTDVFADNQQVSQNLNLSDYTTLEGLFAPDTYYFNYGTTDTKILKKLYETQMNALTYAWQNRASGLPYRNQYEMLIMASIIEKETGVASERSQVSSVFVNRLNQGMRLQTDPTIIYGLFDRYDGKIYKSNIAEKTAYNTYQIDGLPPSPIALPSKQAIDAAAHPDDTPYLYFVATGTGGHTFSTNLADHERAVKQYRQTIAKSP